MTARPPAFARTALVVAVAVTSVLLGAVPRVLRAAEALPEVLRPFVWSDVLHIWERGARDGSLPYRDVAFEYPPLTGTIWIAIQTVAGSAAVHVALWAMVQAIAAGVVAYGLARGAGPGRAFVYWSLAPQLFLFGSVNFETLALAPLVIALLLARSQRTVASSAALAVGTAAKLFPAAVLPVVLVRAAARDARAALVAAAAFATIMALAFAPTAPGPFSSLMSIFRYSVGIEPNLDSIAGLIRAVSREVGWDPLDAIVFASLVGTIFTYVVAVIPAARRAPDVGVAAGLAILSLLLWSRLYSPQYSLWILPFIALLGIPARTYALLTVADVLVFATIYPLTLVRWPHGDPWSPILVAILAGAVVLRHVAIIASWRHISR